MKCVIMQSLVHFGWMMTKTKWYEEKKNQRLLFGDWYLRLWTKRHNKLVFIAINFQARNIYEKKKSKPHFKILKERRKEREIYIYIQTAKILLCITCLFVTDDISLSAYTKSKRRKKKSTEKYSERLPTEPISQIWAMNSERQSVFSLSFANLQIGCISI